MEIGTGIAIATAIYCVALIFMQWRQGKSWDKMKDAADLEARVGKVEEAMRNAELME